MQFQFAVEQGLDELKRHILHEHALALSKNRSTLTLTKSTSLVCIEGTEPASPRPHEDTVVTKRALPLALAKSTSHMCIDAIDPVTPRSQDAPQSPRAMPKEVELPCPQSPTPSEDFDRAESSREFQKRRSFTPNITMTGSEADVTMTGSGPRLYAQVSSMGTEVGEGPLAAWAHICMSILTPRGRYQMMQASGHEITLGSCWADILARPRVSTADLLKCLRKPAISARKSLANRLPVKLTAFFDPTVFSQLHLYVFHPNSWQCLIWYLLSVVFVGYDLFMVPLVLGFDLEDTTFDVNFRWTARCYWTIDIPLHFFVGKHINDFLEMSLRYVARRYLKTWFTLDLLLVIVDWTGLALDSQRASYGGILRALRLFRLLRVLRLARLYMVFMNTVGSKQQVALQIVRLLELMFFLLLWTHFIACAWHGMSYIENSSWDGLHGSVIDRYLIAAHWSLTQVHGTSYTVPVSTAEWGLASLTLFVGLFLLSQFLGAVIHLGFLSTDTSAVRLARACGQYMEKKSIPPVVVRRARGYVVQRHRQEGLSEHIKKERELLDLFPRGLQAQILEATRGSFLKRIPFFELLIELDRRTCRALCQDALKQEMHMKDHTLFTSGDACKHMYFVDHGALAYHHSLNEELPPVRATALHHGTSAMSMDFQRNASAIQGLSLANDWGKTGIEGLRRRFGSQMLMVGSNICEGALWSPWMNIGNLSATCECVLLSLEVAEFERFATTFRQNMAFLIARYARQFVILLKEEPIPSDLFAVHYSREIAMNIDTSEHFDPYQHQMFLSHYKAEAGTEATLLHEGFSRMLADHQAAQGKLGHVPNHVFLDSEDLTDLATLQMHVKGSSSLILLLTPGFLTRPWCLAEIVFAWRCEIRIVPVEIQRPGLKFEYPQQDFFEKVLQGKFLDPAAKELLDKESISAEELVSALRVAFSQIALPFSPHKPSVIREAEMQSIVNRSLGLLGGGTFIVKGTKSLMNERKGTFTNERKHT